MSDQRPEQSGRANQNAQVGAAILVAAAPLFVAGAAVVQMFTASPIAAIVLAAYLIGLLIFAVRMRNASNVVGVRILLGLSAIFAMLLAPMVFAHHEFPFKALLAIITVSYYLALVVGLWSVLKGILSALAALFAVTQAALLVLPPPEGAYDPSDLLPRIVIVKVADENYQAIEGAMAQCSIVGARDREVEGQAMGVELTDSGGNATFEFRPGTRWNVITCSAYKPATETTPGYPPGGALGFPEISGNIMQVYIQLEEER